MAIGEDVKKWVLPLGFVKWKPSVCLRLDHKATAIETYLFLPTGWTCIFAAHEVGSAPVLCSTTLVRYSCLLALADGVLTFS